MIYPNRKQLYTLNTPPVDVYLYKVEYAGFEAHNLILLSSFPRANFKYMSLPRVLFFTFTCYTLHLTAKFQLSLTTKNFQI